MYVLRKNCLSKILKADHVMLHMKKGCFDLALSLNALGNMVIL